MKGHSEQQRSFPIGKGSATVGTDNAIYTSKYTVWNFLFIVSIDNVLIIFIFDEYIFFNLLLSFFALGCSRTISSKW